MAKPSSVKMASAYWSASRLGMESPPKYVMYKRSDWMPKAQATCSLSGFVSATCIQVCLDDWSHRFSGLRFNALEYLNCINWILDTVHCTPSIVNGVLCT